MSAAFARRQQQERDLENVVEIITGGTSPADEVHPEVVEAMGRIGIDVSDAEPSAVSTRELSECDVVATMGCSTLDLDPDVEVRDWALEDPHGKDMETVCEIRDEVDQRVTELFDEYFDGR